MCTETPNTKRQHQNNLRNNFVVQADGTTNIQFFVDRFRCPIIQLFPKFKQ